MDVHNYSELSVMLKGLPKDVGVENNILPLFENGLGKNHSKVQTDSDLSPELSFLSTATLETSLKDCFELNNNDKSQRHPIEIDDCQQSLESSRELYKSVMDAAKQLDSASSKVDTIEKLFSSDLIDSRENLKTLCEKLLLNEPKKYGVLARECLWKSVLYDVMCRSKRLKKGPSFSQIQQAYMMNHLLGGVSQLSFLIMKIQDLKEFSDVRNLFKLDGINNILPALPAPNKPTVGSFEAEALDKWRMDIIYMCLINIGDLYRYLTDAFYKDSESCTLHFVQAYDYYSQAFLLDPTAGLAHNQLGNLSLKLNNGLDSTYYLLYSMCSSNTYGGAYSNLRQLLDGQLVKLATMPAVAELKPIDTFAHTFLGMIYHFVCSGGAHLNNFEKSCQEALLSFHELLNSDKQWMKYDLLYRLSMICVMTVWRLQATNSDDVSAAVAFAAGIFSNLSNHLAIVLKSQCECEAAQSITKADDLETRIEAKSDETVELEIKSPTPSKPAEAVAEKIKNRRDKKLEAKDESVKKDTFVPGKRRLRVKARKLRNQHLVLRDFCLSGDEEDNANNSDGNSNDSDILLSEEEDSNLDENSDFSVDDVDEEDSENENDGLSQDEVQEDFMYEETASSNDYHSDGSSVKQLDALSEKSDDLKENTAHLVLDMKSFIKAFIEIEPVIVAMIPYIRWFRTSPVVISAFSTSCEASFLQNLCDVMNVLRTVNWDRFKELSNDQMNELKQNFLQDWEILLKGDETKLDELFSVELNEDRSMLGISDFKVILKTLKQTQYSSIEEKMIRISRILSFGYWLAGIEEIALIYSHEQKEFRVKSAKDDKYYKQAKKLKELRDKLANEEENVNDNLKNMWKRNRRYPGNRNRNGRRQKPGKFSRNSGAMDPDRMISSDDTLYIFVDLPAILYHFDTIRRLSMYSKFFVIFPQSVHKTLDHLKDTDEEGSKEARIAAAWVEGQKAKGAVRILRDCEKTLLKVDYPESFSPEMWEFFDVLESCEYFRNQEGKLGRPATKFFDDVRDKYRILYLTGHFDLLKRDVVGTIDPMGIGQVCHVFIDRVTVYEENQGRKQKRKRKVHG